MATKVLSACVILPSRAAACAILPISASARSIPGSSGGAKESCNLPKLRSTEAAPRTKESVGAIRGASEMRRCIPSLRGSITVSHDIRKETATIARAIPAAICQPAKALSMSLSPSRMPPSKALIPTKAAVRTSKAAKVLPWSPRQRSKDTAAFASCRRNSSISPGEKAATTPATSETPAALPFRRIKRGQRKPTSIGTGTLGRWVAVGEGESRH